MNERSNLQGWRPGARIDRRQFIRRISALGVSAPLISTGLASIGLAAETPRRGGHLVLGLDGANTSDSLDPATYTIYFMQIVGQQLYNQLTELDVSGRPQPSLAESWDVRPGAKEWVFKIRRGVTFHNGKELTAADVVYSMEHHHGPNSKSPAKTLMAPITTIKATDKYEVTYTLDSPNAEIHYLLSDYHLCIGPEGTNFLDGIGTGAFTLESFQPGERATTKRNPNHWRTDRGFVDSVENLAVNDPSARANGLRSGALHLINRVDARSASLLRNISTIQLFDTPSGGSPTLPMRCNMPPYSSADLRLALKYAIDREQIIKIALGGFATIGNDQPIPSFSPYFAADIPQHSYDPEKAKHHFKKSGFDGPVVLSISDGAFTGAIDCATIFQQNATKAGIPFKIDRVPADGYYTNTWMKVPFCGSYWSPRPTPDLIFSIAYKSDAPWNETFWKKPDFDKILIAARGELDEAKRKHMYHDLQMMVWEDGGEIIPMFTNFLEAAQKKLKGFVPMSSFEMSGLRAPEKVWFES